MLIEAIKPLCCLSIILLGCLAGWRFAKKRIFIPTAFIVWILIVLTFFFFRDPCRKIIQDKNTILAPADGKIIAVDDSINLPGREQSFSRIAIYLSLYDVHVNRIPASGRIVFIKMVPGSFLPAFHPKASDKNESVIIGIQTSFGDIYVKQIAGIIARHIVCCVRMHDEVRQGDRYGMIKFGSRVEIYIPQKYEILIKSGVHVKAGETILARLMYDYP